MSYRVAYDPAPDDPNPHPWDLSAVAFPTLEAADHYAQSEEDELRAEYGDEYVADNFHWLVVRDTVVKETEVPT